LKTRQQRRTFEDTVVFQEQLERLIISKIAKNTALSFKEEERARYLFKRAILSHGTNTFYFRHISGKCTVFPHVSSFFSQLCRIRGSKVKLTDGYSGKEYLVDIKDLWKELLRELEYLFPYAREEAIHMSAEAYVAEVATGRKLSLDEKIHE